MDLSPSDPYALRDYLSLENMLNPPDFSNGTTPMAGAEVTRFHIYLDTGSVEATTFPNLMDGNRYINTFDFPTINEAYRGKEVCPLGIFFLTSSKIFLHLSDILCRIENSSINKKQFCP